MDHLSFIIKTSFALVSPPYLKKWVSNKQIKRNESEIWPPFIMNEQNDLDSQLIKNDSKI